MFEVIAYSDQYGSYGTMGQYESLEDAHGAIEREGCSWESTAECEADYNVYYNGEWIEGWC
jgi:hypothetical protein